MIIGKKFVPKMIRCGRGSKLFVYRYLIAECNHCSKRYDIKNCVKYSLSREYHFCCFEHQKLSQKYGGSLDKAKKCIFLEKYGVITPLLLPGVNERAVKLANSIESRKKASETSYKNWGVKFPTQRPEHIAKCNTQASITKCNETKKRNGSIRESSPERNLFSLLAKHYGKENVNRHVRLCKCSVDMYVQQIKTYIQVDGVYWHGLDRSYEALVARASISPQGKVILCKYHRDRMLDDYAKKSDIRLLRFTDKEIMSDINRIFEIIKNENNQH